jgi:hypothetical protein
VDGDGDFLVALCADRSWWSLDPGGGGTGEGMESGLAAVLRRSNGAFSVGLARRFARLVSLKA